MDECSSSETYPAFFPKGVPPSDARAASGLAFRFVGSVPPAAADFLASIQDNPDLDSSNPQAYGVSFFQELDGCRATSRRYKSFRKKMVVSGVLVPAFGVMKSTPSSTHASHISVWLRTASGIENDFTTSEVL